VRKIIELIEFTKNCVHSVGCQLSEITSFYLLDMTITKLMWRLFNVSCSLLPATAQKDEVTKALTGTPVPDECQ
jgi:hypothetical protein